MTAGWCDIYSSVIHIFTMGILQFISGSLQFTAVILAALSFSAAAQRHKVTIIEYNWNVEKEAKNSIELNWQENFNPIWGWGVVQAFRVKGRRVFHHPLLQISSRIFQLKNGNRGKRSMPVKRSNQAPLILIVFGSAAANLAI